MLTERRTLSRREFGIAAGLFALRFGSPDAARADETRALDERFDFLSKNGNSNCSAAFANSIPKMPVAARLQGSCCAPMERPRYGEQIEGLKKFAEIGEISPDPYDIAAGAAQKALRPRALPGRSEGLSIRDGQFGGEGTLLLSLLALAGLWRARQAPDPRAPLHRRPDRRGVEPV